LKIDYRAHDGRLRAAYVLLPAWYGPQKDPPLTLVISPHGRGVDGRANAHIWGRLPGHDRLAVVNPDGEGRRLPLYSWGAPGQIADLARMPGIVQQALPWLRIAHDRVYAVAGSMGGQEALLLTARYPRLLEGTAVFDAPTDLALQYRDFPQLPCNAACQLKWAGPIGRRLQHLARIEVGGSPQADPAAYAERSPIHAVADIGRSGVPLGFWWSRRDRLVPHPALQEQAFFEALADLHPLAPTLEVVGSWPHVAGMRINNLRRALVWLHLRRGPERLHARRHRVLHERGLEG
jgi:pimeloyl-ACP methyl ester carboxylesterase